MTLEHELTMSPEAIGDQPSAPGDASARAEAIEAHPAWGMISRLPVLLAARIPLRRFTVRKLLALEHGQIIESSWAATEDVPLRVGELRVGWSEFEVVEEKIALRLTRLA